MFLQIVNSALITVISIIVLIDILPLFKDWISRIHIGRYNDKNIWNQSITDVGVKWLNKTPKIKLTDNTRFIAIDMLKGNYTKSAIQHWQEASLLLGLSESLKQKEHQAIISEIEKFLNNKFDSNGNWRKKPKNIDGTMLAYAVMKLPNVDMDHYKKAWDYIWDLIRDHIGSDGTVQYRKNMNDYRYVDTIGFICPFLVLYGARYKKNECIELAVKQIKEYEKNGMLHSHYVPFHAYKIDNKIPLGLNGWGRGLGWFALGLTDTWNEIPSESTYKNELKEIVQKFSKTVIQSQQDNGSWNWTVTLDECRSDSSATASLCWFLLNASKIENISNQCLKSYEKGTKYLMKVTRRNGVVDFSQGDTKGIGVYSMEFNKLPFTQGLCIRSENLYINKDHIVI